MTTISVIDAVGATQTIAKVGDTGQVAMAASLPVVIANDQSAVPVTAASLPLPAGAATATGVAAIVTALGTPAQAGGNVAVTSSALPTGAATAAKQAALGTALTAASSPTTVATDDVMVGALTETAPATDTASSGLNGRLQRIAQRLTSLIALLPGLGTKAMTGSQAVTLATDDTQIGAKTTASVLSAGGSGVIGWLSDAVTSLKALVTGQSSGAQTISIVSGTLGASAGIKVGVDPFGNLTANTPVTQVFNDPFDGSVIDVTDLWTTQVGGAGTVTKSGGKLSLDSGTTASGYAAIFSKQAFSPKNTSIDEIGFTIVIETPLKANTTRFWGRVLVPATPTQAIPVTEGVGFQLDVDGAGVGTFRAVTYAASAIVASTVLTTISDAVQHVYVLFYRGDLTLWLVDNFNVPVASTAVTPNTQTLALGMVAISGSTPPTAGQVMTVNVAASGDSGKNANQISDGTFPWRVANVTSDGSLRTFATDIMVTGQAAQSASGNNVFLAVAGTGSIDAAVPLAYRSFATQIIGSAGIASGQIIFEGSNDNVTFNPLTVYDDAVVTGTTIIAATSIAASTNRFFSGKTQYRFIRCRISTVFAGGTIQAITRFSSSDYVPRVTTVGNPTGANLNAVITSGTVTTVTTVTTCSTVTTLANGQTAHSAASTGSPVRVGGRVNTAVDTTLVAGDASDLFMTTGGAAVVKPYSMPETDWTFAGASGGISNTTTAVTAKAAGAAGVRNYVTGLQIATDTLGAATEFAIRDGAAGTVLWRTKLNTAALPLLTIDFPTPLKGTAATLVEIVTLTATVSGAVFANLQGYQAP